MENLPLNFGNDPASIALTPAPLEMLGDAA
jgi:hypothetical protein